VTRSGFLRESACQFTRASLIPCCQHQYQGFLLIYPQSGKRDLAWSDDEEYRTASASKRVFCLADVNYSEQEDNVAKYRDKNDTCTETMTESLESKTKIVSLTMPQTSWNHPPRPEFTPFTVPYLCSSRTFDGKDFWTYPERCGWIVHIKDVQCHVLCPPGACYNHHKGMSGTEIVQDKEKSRVRPPMLSRSDGKPVIASEKVIFLQRWLFFGFLMEVSNLCGLEIDHAAEFIVGNGLLSTARLNDLPRRWFEAAFKAHRAGDKMIMERILTIARLSKLLLSEELIDEDMPMFRYTYAECLVLNSLDILVRITGLHLLLHVYMPGFIVTEEEGWNRQRIMKSLDWNTPDREGMNQLYKFALDDLKSQGWCKSELRLTPNEAVFARLIPRPRIRDHSCCGDVICDAYQTDEATYRTRHVEDGCNCYFLGVETAVLVAALSEDKVPKLIVTEDLGFRVVSEHKYPYIAFSHTCMSPGALYSCFH